MSVELVTFGCRLNIAEQDAIRRAAAESGCDDAVIVNTCAVTAEAVRQARQSIRRIKRENPAARIVVTGCAAQAEPAQFAAMPEVERVVGNEEKFDAEVWASDTRVAVADIMAAKAMRPHPIDRIEHHTRAFVQVQNGCDHRCTFCIIPFGRGNSRSLPAAEILAQVRRFVDNGYREVVLTGVDITSYGADLAGAPRLGALVKTVLKEFPELARLRLSSIDSVEADRDLMDALADEPRLMPHLHLSLQHGDDLILKRMKRRHSRADAIRFCHEVRSLRPDVAFGADIMAVKAMHPQPIDRIERHTRAFVQVQNGCDHRCTFCIIPFGRGNSRSLPVTDVLAQVRRFVDNGYREVVLTGVDITSYGADLAGAPRLGALVKTVLKEFPELARL
ncbi:MAG TPA: radical SAM protein, partial [Pseudolabrys sp.]|nr:radical SAM protein [Pseudolabrys sp.]